MPLTKPLSNEPMLDLIFAIALPAIASALLFNIGASSGGTDVIAMLLKKYTNIKRHRYRPFCHRPRHDPGLPALSLI